MKNPADLHPQTGSYVYTNASKYIEDTLSNPGPNVSTTLLATSHPRTPSSSLRPPPSPSLKPQLTPLLHSQVTQLALVHDCTSLMFLWEFNGVGGPMAPEKNRVRGISYQRVDPERKKVISHQVEFNSAAWALNTGFTIEQPTEGEYAEEEPAEGEAPPPAARKERRSWFA
jgi:hypothetical protein